MKKDNISSGVSIFTASFALTNIEQIPNDIKQASEELEKLKEKEGNKNE